MVHLIIDVFVRRWGFRSLQRLGLLLILSGAILFPTANSNVLAATVAVVSPTASLLDAASSDAQVIGRISQGSSLTATGRKSGDWIEVQAPAEVSGWVYGELVRDGIIAASSVKVRSGPGIGYVSLGTLTKGARVVQRGSSGDWFEIEGQPFFMVWVERAMVAERASSDLTVAQRPSLPPAPEILPAAPPVQETTPTPPVISEAPSVPPLHPAMTVDIPPPLSDVRGVDVRPPEPIVVLPAVTSPSVPEPPVVRSVEPRSVAAPVIVAPESSPAYASRVAPARPPLRASVPPAQPTPVRSAVHRQEESSGRWVLPAGLRLISTAPQGESVMVAGVLRPAGFSLFSSADYRLVHTDGQGPFRTLCYVTGDPNRLREKLGQSVTVDGRKYWVYGSREPVVLVQSIR